MKKKPDLPNMRKGNPPEQLPLPFPEIKQLSKYEDLPQEKAFQLSRLMDSAITKDFSCAIPKVFPKNGEYKRERTYQNPKTGQTFVKRYTLKGAFKESDEDYRIFLTAYYKLLGGKDRRFTFSIYDFLRFKGLDPDQQKNLLQFKNFLRRTRSNEWSMNCWFDYGKREFRQERFYGIIQEYTSTTASGEKGQPKNIITLTWAESYYEALKEEKNWKYFNLDIYSGISEQSQTLKKLLAFLGNGNSEFMEEHREEGFILVKIALRTLCEFFLAFSPAQDWKYKQQLLKHLIALQKLGLATFQDVKDCFIKEEGQTWLQLNYTPLEIKKSLTALQESLITMAPVLDRKDELYLAMIIEDGMLLSKISISKAKFEANWIENKLGDSAMSYRDIAFNLAYVVWGNSNPNTDTPYVKAPRHVFRTLMGKSTGSWEIQPAFQAHWMHHYQGEIERQLKKEEMAQIIEEKRKKEDEERKIKDAERSKIDLEFNSLSVDERWDQIHYEFIKRLPGYPGLEDESLATLKEKLITTVFPKYKKLVLIEGQARILLNETLDHQDEQRANKFRKV